MQNCCKMLLTFLLAAGPALAQEKDAETAFVEANVLAIFYHELGHAVIDLMEVPIFGQEEDAADTMAVLLIDQLFDEATAQDIAADSAFGFLNDPDGTQEVAYWDLHGPDEQRYFNHICLFYGANPEAREELASDLGLPDERAETCEDEYLQAAQSWGVIFDELDAPSDVRGMDFVPGKGSDAQLIASVIAPELTSINADFSLPKKTTVRVEKCDEPNAFYDPESTEIIICQEFAPHLRQIFRKLPVE